MTHLKPQGCASAGLRSAHGAATPLWAQVDAQTRALWERDGSLLLVAGKARAERLTSAWHKLAPPR